MRLAEVISATAMSGQKVPILQNPSPEVLLSQLRRIRGMRGIVLGNDLFWASSYSVIHVSISKAIGAPNSYGDARLDLRMHDGKPKLTILPSKDETYDQIAAVPGVARLQAYVDKARLSERLIESAETDYPTFEAEWGDYVADLTDNEVTFEWYDEVRQQLEHEFARHERMYRIIDVVPNWIDQLRRNKQQPLGVHWSIRHLDWHPSTDPYDRRFAYPQGKKITVLMTARMPPYAAINWNACVASAMATSEEELRVVEGASIELMTIDVDGRDMSLNVPRPA